MTIEKACDAVTAMDMIVSERRAGGTETAATSPHSGTTNVTCWKQQLIRNSVKRDAIKKDHVQ